MLNIGCGKYKIMSSIVVCCVEIHMGLSGFQHGALLEVIQFHV